MAKVVNLTSLPMDNNLDQARVLVYLVPADAVYDTLAKRLRVEVTGQAVRDDGKPSEEATRTYFIEQDSDVGTFGAGDAAALRLLLKDLYDQWRIDEGVN